MGAGLSRTVLGADGSGVVLPRPSSCRGRGRDPLHRLRGELAGPLGDLAAPLVRLQGRQRAGGLHGRCDAAARRRFLENPRRETLRLTGTKHPDPTAHRREQLARAVQSAASLPAGDPDRADRVLEHLEWNPLVEAWPEFEETITDLLGPCTEVLLDFEGRQISSDWLDVPEKVVLALLRHGIVPGEDRHLLFRVPNPWLEQDEEKVSKILASVARASSRISSASPPPSSSAGSSPRRRRRSASGPPPGSGSTSAPERSSPAS